MPGRRSARRSRISAMSSSTASAGINAIICYCRTISIEVAAPNWLSTWVGNGNSCGKVAARRIAMSVSGFIVARSKFAVRLTSSGHPHRRAGMADFDRPIGSYRQRRTRFRDDLALFRYRSGGSGFGRIDLCQHLRRLERRAAGAVADYRPVVRRSPAGRHRLRGQTGRMACLLSHLPRLPTAAVPAAAAVARACLPGIVGQGRALTAHPGRRLAGHMGFRIYSALNTAIARPKMVMTLQIAGLLLKVPLNFLFIFGGLGLPALGGPGCALATAATAWLTFLVGWGIVRRNPSYRSLGLFGTGYAAPRWAAQRSLLRLGIPMGLSYLIEVTAFTFMALFIARLGETVVAGHQITANFGTVLYMLPLSIANATGTLVAQAIGARDWQAARRIGHAGILLAAVLSAAIGAAVWLARGLIIRAYTPDPAVFAAAAPLFLFIGFYQLFDAVQVTTAFVLRAYKVAVVPTLMYAVALWGVGLGGGYVLGLNPFGVWPPGCCGICAWCKKTSCAMMPESQKRLRHVKI